MANRDRALAIVCLTLLTTVLPEMLSGNTAAELLFRPDVFIFFALAYALPILVIRDWAVRLGLNGGGIFLAGMAYGLINEGLLAKTIFREAGVPIDVFDHYGYGLGVNFSWALLILTWHGLSSVLFPITLTHVFVPQAAQRPWFGKKTAAAMAIFAAVLTSLFFLNDESSGPKGSGLMLAALWAAMAALAVAASRLRGGLAQTPSFQRWKPFLFGVAGLAFFIAILLVARVDAPLPLYALAFAALAAIWIFVLLRFGWQNLPAFGRVAHGWYVQMAGFGWISMVHRSPPTVAVGAVILLIFHWLCLRFERRMTR